MKDTTTDISKEGRANPATVLVVKRDIVILWKLTLQSQENEASLIISHTKPDCTESTTEVVLPT